MRVAVTGANGFVGHALVKHLTGYGHRVLAYVRQPEGFNKTAGVVPLTMPNLLSEADWRLRPMQETDVFVHCAARVHVLSSDSSDHLADFHRVNVGGTVDLARQAAAAGVKRFVYLSSIKVNGEFTDGRTPFTADDLPAPEDPYSVSKFEAERELWRIATATGMEVVIIRPPLVYGPGVKANFESMMRWLYCGLPMPLAAITQNRRSLVAIDNLVGLIMTCLSHPAAANQTFLVSDGEDLSTAELLRRMGNALGHPARLFYVPASLLKLGARVMNMQGIYQRLCGSLQLDISKTQQLLGWAPAVSVDEGLRRTGEGFRL